MKNSPLYRRLLSVALAFAMIFATLTPTSLVAKAANGPAETKKELELTPVDPSTLESRQTAKAHERTDKELYSATDVVRVSIVLENAVHDAFAFRMINAINVSGIPVSGKDTILQNIPDILVCYSVKKIRCNKCKSGQSLLPVNDKDFSFDLVCYKHIQVIPGILGHNFFGKL